MKIVFVGAVEGSRIALDALIKAGQPPTLVITLPPELAGRHSDYADLSTMAKLAGSTVLFTQNINARDVIDVMRRAEPDLCLIIGWSQICKAEFRAIARHGNIGFHPAPLPRFRGRAVIPWTILQGEATSGSTLFWLDEGIDSGPILLQTLFPVASDETARSLYSKQVANLAAMLPQAVRLVQDGSAPSMPQDQTWPPIAPGERPMMASSIGTNPPIQFFVSFAQWVSPTPERLRSAKEKSYSLIARCCFPNRIGSSV